MNDLNIDIPYYNLFCGSGTAIAVLLLWFRVQKSAPQLTSKFPAMLLVVLGSAFIGSVGFTWVVVPESAFRLPIAGFTFLGGVIGGACGLIGYALINRLPILETTDLFAAPLAIGHGIGRLGCFFGGCCYGCASEGFWQRLGFEMIPVQLMECIACIGIGIVLIVLQRWSGRKSGDQIALYLFLYGLVRILLETLRCDDRGMVRIGSLSIDSPSTLVSIIGILVALLIFVSRYWRKNNVK